MSLKSENKKKDSTVLRNSLSQYLSEYKLNILITNLYRILNFFSILAYNF